MWKIEVIQRRNYKILIFMKGNDEDVETRGSIEVQDDGEYERWLKVLEMLNANS